VNDLSSVQQKQARRVGDGWYSVLYDNIANGRYAYRILNGTTEVTRGEVDVKHGGKVLVNPPSVQITTHVPQIQQTVDRWGNVTSQTNALGMALLTSNETYYQDLRVSLGYSALVGQLTTGQQLKIISEHTANFAYNYLNQITLETTPTVSVWDEQGLETRQALKTRHYYDIQGRQIGLVDARGIVSGKQYNDVGQLVKEYRGQYTGLDNVVGSDGGIVKHYYDELGREINRENANGALSYYEYDKNNRLVMEKDPVGFGANGQYVETSYQYDELGNRVASTNGEGEITQYFYDDFGNVILTRLGEGANNPNTKYFKKMLYDVNGNKIAESNGNGDYQTWNVDYFGRVISYRDLGGITTSYTYNDLGLLATQSNIGTRGQDIKYEYYDNGQLKRIIDSASKTETSYEYDINGNKTRERFRNIGLGVTYQDVHISYDELLRLSRIQDNRYDTQYRYDEDGNRRNVLTTYRANYTNGVVEKTVDYWYTYDAMNRIIVSQGVNPIQNGAIDIIEGQGQKFSYDSEGNRRSAKFYEDTGNTDANGNVIYAFVEETYTYTANNLLEGVHRAGQLSWIREYDRAGREIVFKGVANYGQSNEQDQAYRTTTYNKNGWVSTTENLEFNQSLNNGLGGWQLVSRVSYEDAVPNNRKIIGYRNDGTAISKPNENYQIGYDAVGNVLGYIVRMEKGTKHTIFYTNSYDKYGSYLQKQIDVLRKFDSTFADTSGQTVYQYDQNGNLLSIEDSEGQPLDKLRTYITNTSGLILQKHQGKETQHYFYVNGNPAGSMGVTLQFDDTLGIEVPKISADFDYNYTPVSTRYPSQIPGSYVVSQDGETLQSIAQAVYGDSNLWYIIADANGITSDSSNLKVGMTLKIPNNITNIRNSAGTFATFNPGEIIGDANPTIPDPPPVTTSSSSHGGGGGCGGFGVFLEAIVSAYVTYVTGGNYFLGNLAGQAVGNLIGTRDGFSAEEAIAAAITGQIIDVAGIGMTPEEVSAAAQAGNWGSIAVSAIEQNLVSQTVSVALGVQDNFSWESLAVAAIAAPINAKIGQTTFSNDQFVNDFTQGVLKGATTNALQIAAYGGGKMQWTNIVADSFGNAIGNSIVNEMKKSSAQEQKAEKLRKFLNLVNSDTPFYVDENGNPVVSYAMMRPSDLLAERNHQSAPMYQPVPDYSGPVIMSDSGRIVQGDPTDGVIDPENIVNTSTASANSAQGLGKVSILTPDVVNDLSSGIGSFLDRWEPEKGIDVTYNELSPEGKYNIYRKLRSSLGNKDNFDAYWNLAQVAGLDPIKDMRTIYENILQESHPLLLVPQGKSLDDVIDSGIMSYAARQFGEDSGKFDEYRASIQSLGGKKGAVLDYSSFRNVEVDRFYKTFGVTNYDDFSQLGEYGIPYWESWSVGPHPVDTYSLVQLPPDLRATALNYDKAYTQMGILIKSVGENLIADQLIPLLGDHKTTGGIIFNEIITNHAQNVLYDSIKDALSSGTPPYLWKFTPNTKSDLLN